MGVSVNQIPDVRFVLNVAVNRVMSYLLTESLSDGQLELELEPDRLSSQNNSQKAKSADERYAP